MGGAAVSLTLKSGEIWVFRHDGSTILTLERHSRIAMDFHIPRPGDVVTAVAGREVRTVPDLLSAVASLSPGKKATLDVQRRENVLQIEVVPGQRNVPRNPVPR